MSKTLVKQLDDTDCGPACLASIAAHYDLLLNISKIRQLAGTDENGTTMAGLITAAEKIGFEAFCIRGKPESLTNIPLPAIAHLQLKKMQHYVVIYKVNEKNILLMDPSYGKIYKRSRHEFLSQWTGVLLLLSPTDDFKPGSEKKPILTSFWKLIKPHKKILLQAVFGAIVYTILGLSTAIYVQKIADHVLVEGNARLLHIMSFAMFVLLVVRVFIGTLKSMLTMRTGQEIDAQLILGYHQHLLKLPQQFFDSMRAGEIISRINDGVKIRTFINDVAINLIVNVFIVLFSFALMFTYYWKLALLILLAIPSYIAIYLVVNELNKTTQRKLMEQSADLESQLLENIRGISTIKRFGIGKFMTIKTEILFFKFLKTVYKSGTNGLFAANSVEAMSQLLIIVLLSKGAGYVLDLKLTAGQLFSFYTLTGYFLGPASSLVSINKILHDAKIAAERLFEIMDLDTEKTSDRVPLIPEMIADIKFDNVTFGYSTRPAIFEQLNLKIDKGKFTAIIGESGSGKSTLMALIQNIYSVKKGHILIGNYDLNYLDPDTLRKMIAIVPQQTDLFCGTVIDNIAIGEEEPDMKLVIDICRELDILNFIEHLPNGFRTELGENGIKLSGGQRQRISIARALYRKPEILMLDEATSSLDTKAENYVLSTVKLLQQQNKTVIVITHKLTNICTADKIVVLSEGKIIEEGSHDLLMKKNEHYSSLWKQQFAHQSI